MLCGDVRGTTRDVPQSSAPHCYRFALILRVETSAVLFSFGMTVVNSFRNVFVQMRIPLRAMHGKGSRACTRALPVRDQRSTSSTT